MTPTPRQAEVMDVIREYRHDFGYAPTMQEIGEILEVSRVTVWHHVQGLSRKRLVRFDKHKARSIEVLAPAPVRRRLVFPVTGFISRFGVEAEAVEA